METHKKEGRGELSHVLIVYMDDQGNTSTKIN